MNPAFVLNGKAQYLSSYFAVSSVEGMKASACRSIASLTSSSQFCAAYSAVQITSTPSTSHCDDSARSRWICSRR